MSILLLFSHLKLVLVLHVLAIVLHHFSTLHSVVLDHTEHCEPEEALRCHRNSRHPMQLLPIHPLCPVGIVFTKQGPVKLVLLGSWVLNRFNCLSSLLLHQVFNYCSELNILLDDLRQRRALISLYLIQYFDLLLNQYEVVVIIGSGVLLCQCSILVRGFVVLLLIVSKFHFELLEAA